MKRLIGWFLLIVGSFVLGAFMYRLLFVSSTNISPIPNNDSIRVIILTPGSER